MPQNITLETYISSEKEFENAIAEKVTKLLDFSFAQADKKVEQIATQKKLEIKDELSKELASKADIAILRSEIDVVRSEIDVVRSEIDVVKVELQSEIKSSKHESRLYFIILLCVMIVLNRENITLIGQILGLVK